MSKVITSPSKRWPGSGTIADPLTLPTVESIEAAMDFSPKEGEKIWLTILDKEKMPAILACTEKWELENFPSDPTMENWPLSPRPASHKLINWLWEEIRNVYIGELEVPNE